MLDFLKKVKVMVVDVMLPVGAFVLSLVALFISQNAQDDVARMEAVKTEYDIYNDLAKLQQDNPVMAHLFAFKPAAYRPQVASIRAAVLSTASNERLKLLLQEQAVAHYIFTHYEETYFLSKQAADGEERRRKWLEANLQYFDKFFCGNPRLLWYWSGRKLGENFAQALQNHYDDYVVEGCQTQPDPLGPFSDQGETK